MAAHQLSAVETRIVHHTDDLGSSLAVAARLARESLYDQAIAHPSVMERSLRERRHVIGNVVDISVSHDVSVTDGGIVLSVLATGTLVEVPGIDTGENW